MKSKYSRTKSLSYELLSTIFNPNLDQDIILKSKIGNEKKSDSGKKLYLFSTILKSRSPGFEAKIKEKQMELELEYNYYAVKTVVEYLYTGSFAIPIKHPENESLDPFKLASDLYSFCCEYSISELITKSEKYLLAELQRDDPNLVQNDDDDSEKDDLIIKNTDLLAIAAKSEEEMSSLEIYLYEEKQDNFYVHHDIILPTFPLSLAWLNSAPDSYLKERSIESGNFVAVGTFDPTIEIWDLDILDAEAPIAMLGGLSEKPRKRRVKKKTGRNRGMRFEIEPILKYKPESHTDSVLGLSWNKLHHNLLSSGSADKTVKIWEIPTQQCLHTLSHHSNKVQSVSWNPKNDSLLLTAGYDSAAFICDIKQNLTKNQGITKFSLSSEVEYCAWNPIESDKFIVSTDDGIVQYYDIRNHSSPIFSANCHKKETTSISFSLIPGLLVTAGTDKSIKIWDLQGNQLTFIYAKEFPEIGKIFSVKFSDDSPFVVSFGGSQGKVSFWDLTTLKQVQDRFISRIPQMNSSKKK
eukprot:Anaeramoba_ignava/c20275_g3_i1.p1 GENE.c20275_g3_i1~~c20275_g3_i1.p1  ORF type:complete len:541 (+),score=183.42 c20275_g3_i1:55-1623(+)